MRANSTISIPHHSNIFLYSIGAGLLLVNKLRKRIGGYTNPRGFSSTDTERAITYDLSVVASWQEHLSNYTKDPQFFVGKHILELGPGADLGVGLILLSRGANRYTALDKHRLITSAPPALYEKLLASKELDGHYVSKDELNRELVRALAGESDRIVYRVDPKFTISALTPTVDVVVSQAAFEHFENLPALAQGLSQITHSGSVLCAEIDLQTHSRWIREHDPLNIYRYSDWFYNFCAFSGTPNRWRPYEYQAAFARAGWEDIQILPLLIAPQPYTDYVRPQLAERFKASHNELSILTCMLLARKK